LLPEDALYTGVVEMTITYGGSDWQDTYDCTGEFDLTVTPEGVGTGTASCGDRDYTVDGPLEGVAQPGSFTGTWTIDVGRDTYEADVHGLLTESDATFDVALEDWGFTATGTMTGTRAR
jgi:hypothetical protein